MDKDIIKQNNPAEENPVEEYNYALANTPIEVRTFMWSPAYQIILQAIKETFKLSDTQIKTVERVSNELIVGTMSIEDAEETLTGDGIEDELQEKVITAINEEIISRALSQVEFYQGFELENEEKGISPTPSQEKKKQDNSKFLDSFSERFTAPRPITPIATVTAPTVERPKPQGGVSSIDPYRELPEE